MSLLQLHQGTKQFGIRTLFDQASFAIQEGEHIGVIGPNGAGKTTLFKIICGLETLDSGVLTTSQGLRLAYLEQESDWSLELSVEDFLIKKCIKPIWELKQIGHELGLTLDHFQSPVKSLSGGYRMRVQLLSMIGQEPNLMLLDEPTNFLDLESVLALEKFLQNYSGAFLLISHDREFLKRTTESTLEVESGEITKFPGHIDDYFEQKIQLQQQLEARAANLETKRQHIQSFVDRFRSKATKAKQAQSRLKQLEKMEQIELKELPIRSHIQIPEPQPTGKEILNLENGDLGYLQNKIISGVELRLERGAHLGIVGHNGAGKSTLLKSLAGQIPLLGGTRKLGYQVSLSIYSQHSAEQLDMTSTVLSELQSAANADCTSQEILNMAGSLLFSGDDVHKKIRVLSGGEKSRVALGQILLRKSPLLLLDEPTNHLDFETVEALTEALKKFSGTIIVVSHDRSFISRVATKILVIQNGQLDLYPGTYDEYVWSLQKGNWGQPVGLQTEKKLNTPNSNTSTENEKFNFRNKMRELANQQRELQKKINQSEKFLLNENQKREAILQNLLSAQGPSAQNLARELSQTSSQIEKNEDLLLNWLEELDKIEKAIAKLQNNPNNE